MSDEVRKAYEAEGTMLWRYDRMMAALRRIGQVNTDTGNVGDDVCATCAGWATKTLDQAEASELCPHDCPGRIARVALSTSTAPASDDERKYPCDDCGVMRTKAEGGTTFTVCDACWDKHYGKPAPTLYPPRWEGGMFMEELIATKCPGCNNVGQACYGLTLYHNDRIHALFKARRSLAATPGTPSTCGTCGGTRQLDDGPDFPPSPCPDCINSKERP